MIHDPQYQNQKDRLPQKVYIVEIERCQEVFQITSSLYITLISSCLIIEKIGKSTSGYKMNIYNSHSVGRLFKPLLVSVSHENLAH